MSIHSHRGSFVLKSLEGAGIEPRTSGNGAYSANHEITTATLQGSGVFAQISEVLSI